MKSRRCSSLITLALILCAGAWLCAPLEAAAQSALTFVGAEEPVPATGLGNTLGVSFDVLGNLFIADTANNRIVETAAQTQAQTVLPIAGLSGPRGVTVDGSGNVFVLDGGNRIVEYSASGTQRTVNTSGLTGLSAITASGPNLIVVTNSGGNELYYLSTTGGAPTPEPVNGLNSPHAVAVDLSGNIFIADTGNSRIVEVLNGGRQVTFMSGLNAPVGVGVDAAGNVFYAEANSMRIGMVPASGGQPTYLAGAYSQTPANLAVTLGGDVVFLNKNTNALTAIYRTAVPVPTANVCPNGQLPSPCSQQVTLSYYVNYDTTLGNTTVLTQGVSGLDFTMAATTCAGALNSRNTCTVTVKFTPSAPGLRRGAVNLLDPTNSTAMDSTLVFGQGSEALAAFAPGTQTTLSSANAGYIDVAGAAVDPAGNIFTVDTSTGNLQELVYSNGTYRSTTLANISAPRALALDGAGNIFVATGQGLLEFTRTAAGTYTQNFLTTDSIGALAIDARGAIYYPSSQYVSVAVPTGSGYQMTQLAISSPSNDSFAGLAVDQAGALYVVDGGSTAYKFTPTPGGGNYQPPVGGGNYKQSTIATNLNFPTCIQLGPDGSVYVGNGNSIEKISPASAGSTVIQLGSFPGDVFGFAVAPNGNLFVPDPSNYRLVEINVATPPSFTFKDTRVGGISTDSPRNVVVESVGNVPLAASPSGGLSFPTGFTQSGGTGTPPDCMSTFYLVPAALCELNLNFTPTAQTAQGGFVTLTDNAMNTANNTQQIAVSGNGVSNVPELVFPNPGNQIYNASLQLTASSNAPGPITYSLVLGPATVSASGAVKITGSGQVIVQAMQAPAAGYTAQTLNDSFMALQGASKVSITVTPVTTAKSGTSLKVVVTYSSNSSGTPSGQIILSENNQQVQQFNIAGGSYTTGALSKGSYTFSATYNGDANFTSSSASTTYQLVPGYNAYIGSATGALFQLNHTPNELESPSGGYTANAGGKQSSPLSIGADRNGTIWLANNNSNTLGAITFTGLPVDGQPFSGGGLNAPVGLAVDGLGQIWIANAASVSAFSNAGVPISPASGYTDPSISGTTGVAIDISGSVWVSNSNSLTQILGVAAPVLPPGSANARKKIGVRP